MNIIKTISLAKHIITTSCQYYEKKEQTIFYKWMKFHHKRLKNEVNKIH